MLKLLIHSYIESNVFKTLTQESLNTEKRRQPSKYASKQASKQPRKQASQSILYVRGNTCIAEPNLEVLPLTKIK